VHGEPATTRWLFTCSRRRRFSFRSRCSRASSSFRSGITKRTISAKIPKKKPMKNQPSALRPRLFATREQTTPKRIAKTR